MLRRKLWFPLLFALLCALFLSGSPVLAWYNNHTLTFTLPADALGRPRSLKGAKLYVTTWDYDGGYRALQPAPTRYAISGGDGNTDPLIMDDTPILELK